MRTDDFDYELPEHLIAQTPLEKRDNSKLLILDKTTGEINHSSFHNIIDELSNGDILVLNDTKVLPARIYGIKEETNACIELLMLKETEKDTWECLTKPAKRVKLDSVITFGDGRLKARCIDIKDEGIRVFKLEYEGILYEILDSLGEMPLPPYIHEKLKEKDIEVLYITLHVGLGTFRPVSVDDVTKHKMHSEFYMMEKEVADKLNKAKKENKRIVAVGTTTTRTLETIMNLYNEFKECSGWTDIFIYPGYEFKAINALITNFHLPKSTLVMLVSALAGKENVLNAYNEAVKNEYRFFSFGDSMFIK